MSARPPPFSRWVSPGGTTRERRGVGATGFFLQHARVTVRAAGSAGGRGQVSKRAEVLLEVVMTIDLTALF